MPLPQQTGMRFPDPRRALSDVVAVGGGPAPALLSEAYRRGIFPWPSSDLPYLAWFSPRLRAVLFFDEIHCSRSLVRARQRSTLSFTIDQAFDQVIRACAEASRNGEGTWITAAVIDGYRELHGLGMAHSVEAWRDGLLVGGLYGVDAGGVFCGESMFYKESNASKLALLFLVDHLAAGGARWLDVQVMTPHMKALGAKTIRRSRFLDLLAQTQERELRLFVQTTGSDRKSS
jgi:leucyl/phenylalanyl-tRNA--protein transferase